MSQGLQKGRAGTTDYHTWTVAGILHKIAECTGVHPPAASCAPVAGIAIRSSRSVDIRC